MMHLLRCPLQSFTSLQAQAVCSRKTVMCCVCPAQMNGSVQDELQEMILQLLALKAPLLKEQWGVTISDGRLHTLPVLVAGYTPDMDALPEFLVSLAVDVSWDNAERRLTDVAQVCFLMC